MKQLAIVDENHLDLGSYNAACEGFVDAIKKLFVKPKPNEIAQRVDKLKEKELLYSSLEKDLKEDLNKTYNNPEWVEKNLSGNSGTISNYALKRANTSGKAITDLKELVSIADGMLSVVKAISAREKPFIEQRIKLVKEISKETDPKVFNTLWFKHASALKRTAADRYRQTTKKPTPAFGDNSSQYNTTWPIDFANPKRQRFNTTLNNQTNGSIEAPTPQNAASFVKTINTLVDIYLELNNIADNGPRVPYFDCLDIEYDDLDDSGADVEDIYSYLTSSQSDMEVSDLAYGAESAVGIVIIGLYIAMFDKHK